MSLLQIAWFFYQIIIVAGRGQQLPPASISIQRVPQLLSLSAEARCRCNAVSPLRCCAARAAGQGQCHSHYSCINYSCIIRNGREPVTPCRFHPSNSPIYLYAVDLLIAHGKSGRFVKRPCGQIERALLLLRIMPNDSRGNDVTRRGRARYPQAEGRSRG